MIYCCISTLYLYQKKHLKVTLNCNDFKRNPKIFFWGGCRPKPRLGGLQRPPNPQLFVQSLYVVLFFLATLGRTSFQAAPPFRFQDIKTLPFLKILLTSKSVTLSQTLLHIRSYTSDCFFRIRYSVKMN